MESRSIQSRLISVCTLPVVAEEGVDRAHAPAALVDPFAVLVLESAEQSYVREVEAWHLGEEAWNLAEEPEQAVVDHRIVHRMEDQQGVEMPWEEGHRRLVGRPFVLGGEVHPYLAMVREVADRHMPKAEQRAAVVHHVVEFGLVVVALRRLEAALRVVVPPRIAVIELEVVVRRIAGFGLEVVVRHIVEVELGVVVVRRIVEVELEVVVHHTVAAGLEGPYQDQVALVFQGLACRADLGVLAFLEDHLQGLEGLHHPVAQSA